MAAGWFTHAREGIFPLACCICLTPSWAGPCSPENVRVTPNMCITLTRGEGKNSISFIQRHSYCNEIPLTQGLNLKCLQGLGNHVHKVGVREIMKASGGLRRPRGPMPIERGQVFPSNSCLLPGWKSAYCCQIFQFLKGIWRNLDFIANLPVFKC